MIVSVLRMIMTMIFFPSTENYGLDNNLITLAEVYQYGHSFPCVVIITSILQNTNDLILIRLAGSSWKNSLLVLSNNTWSTKRGSDL